MGVKLVLCEGILARKTLNFLRLSAGDNTANRIFSSHWHHLTFNLAPWFDWLVQSNSLFDDVR